MIQVVHTVEACRDMMRPLREELSDLHPPALNPDQEYSVPWILRSKFVLVLRHAKVMTFKVKTATTLEDLHETFPDANDWLKTIAASSNNLQDILKTPLKSVLTSLRYNHPPELLSMFLCLFGDADVLTFPMTWLKKHKAELKAFRLEYKYTEGVEAHPYILLHAFKRKKDQTVLKRPAGAM